MSINQPLIVIVDDNEFNLEILNKNLKVAGYTNIRDFSDGVQAWDYMQENSKIDIAILDRMMPIMTGLELAQKMKNDPRLKDIPIIFQTVYKEQECFEECMEAGAFSYITKPFDQDILKSELSKALKHTKKLK